MRPGRDAIVVRGTRELFHRPGLKSIVSRVAVLRVAFQQSLALKEAADAPCNTLSKPGQLGAGRRFHPAELQRAVRTLDVHSVEEPYMEVDGEVERTAESLNQRDRASLSLLTREPDLLDQMRGDATLEDAEYPAHDIRAAGKAGSRIASFRASSTRNNQHVAHQSSLNPKRNTTLQTSRTRGPAKTSQRLGMPRSGPRPRCTRTQME